MGAFDRIGDETEEFDGDVGVFALTSAGGEVEAFFIFTEEPIDGGGGVSDGFLPEFVANGDG